MPATDAAISSSVVEGRLGFHRVGKHEIAYIAHNEQAAGTPLVFVHGLSMSVRFWELAMLPEIKEQLCWYSISLPLHVPSRYAGSPGEADLSEAAFAKTLGETVRHLVGERPVRVVGHSVGAFSALAFALAYPQLCAGVMLIGGFAQGWAEGLAGGLRFIRNTGRVGERTFKAIWGLQQKSKWFMRQLVKQYAADREALVRYKAFQPTLDLVYPDVRAHDLDGQFNMVRHLLHLDVFDDAHRITCQVWVVAGSLDPVVSFAHQRQIAEYLPNAQLHVLEGAGHLGFAEREQEFNALLLRFAGL